MRVPFKSSKGAAIDASSTWLGSAAEHVYDRTTRRSFITKVGAVLVSAGVAPLALEEPASADAASCCTGPNCSRFGLRCRKTPGSCPQGSSYTGYTWTCCAGGQGKVMICTDCTLDTDPAVLCVCTTPSRDPCDRTMTELAEQYPVLQGRAS